MSSIFEKVATGVMALAACAVAVKYVAAPATGNAVAVAAAMTKQTDWEAAFKYALPRKSTHSTASVIEYIDLECPFCASYAQRIDSLRATMVDSVDIYYVNMPISSHRFARSGAIAVECAFRAGRGAEFVSTAYANRDSIGFWTWPKMAITSGVTDTISFNMCTKEPGVSAAVDSSRAFAVRTKVVATPTVSIGAWRYGGPPTLQELQDGIRRVSRNQRPQEP